MNGGTNEEQLPRHKQNQGKGDMEVTTLNTSLTTNSSKQKLNPYYIIHQQTHSSWVSCGRNVSAAAASARASTQTDTACEGALGGSPWADSAASSTERVRTPASDDRWLV
ncbi:hypothetical protein S7711_10688 [Stachybotrys chartarum IBT 7711]|uniref:Uncharacterized protein n=1 Tax=Stachybotrys chartarum (strain CBS 109288 / IBT 7711) TaxID=1280523 RepID=A0A084AUM0_STACB|nr:hypothetical protein S7711_10688 [Stachybotrys chartarum IBT 7711]KFA52951.1 hypothetical protein S40293_10430 [Stachybotrys chartarum IBT 40293]